MASEHQRKDPATRSTEGAFSWQRRHFGVAANMETDTMNDPNNRNPGQQREQQQREQQQRQNQPNQQPGQRPDPKAGNRQDHKKPGNDMNKDQDANRE